MARLLEFKNRFCNPSNRTNLNVNEYSVERVKTIRPNLTSIINSIEFCDRNGVAVHGHGGDLKYW